jgi:hypothetical protein
MEIEQIRKKVKSKTIQQDPVIGSKKTVEQCTQTTSSTEQKATQTINKRHVGIYTSSLPEEQCYSYYLKMSSSDILNPFRPLEGGLSACIAYSADRYAIGECNPSEITTTTIVDSERTEAHIHTYWHQRNQAILNTHPDLRRFYLNTQSRLPEEPESFMLVEHGKSQLDNIEETVIWLVKNS